MKNYLQKYNDEILKIKTMERVGMTKYNNQGSLMKVIEYKDCHNVTIEFQDEYKYKTLTQWKKVENGQIRNPYFPSVFNVGMTGEKYKTIINNKMPKEYNTWREMLRRCYDEETKEKHPTYKNVTCCKEWLLYENFYEWLHEQENFEKWINDKRSALDKDILVKGNKIYSPDTCCLVPQYVNTLFIKKDANRGDLPIGVFYNIKQQRYYVMISMLKNEKIYRRNAGYYPTPEDAFYLGYKPTKENYIKKIAQEEYENGNITKRCYEAMMNYQVEITD